MDTLNLIDTPKRLSLSSRSIDLRVSLKEWEKSFAATHAGQKPGKTDIKADQDISRKYKEYNRLRDVLAGKLSLEALNEQKSPTRPTKRVRADSGVSFTPRKSSRSQERRPHELDPYDHPATASPRPLFFDAIGPTPQRDGKVLGLFDLLTNSSRSSQTTPSAKKRKIDALHNEAGKEGAGFVAQTPGKRIEKAGGDLLQHLAADCFDSASKRKHSRTPASEGKKFLLSQFFATPTALRYTSLVANENSGGNVPDKTPLRSMVLGLSPLKPALEDPPALDATPAYLKRSFSFKDRLLSASTVPTIRASDDQNVGFTSPSAVRRRPRALQRTKSMPKPLSQIVKDLRKLEDEPHDDDMDALREMEGNIDSGVQVSDSQITERMPEEGWHADENNSVNANRIPPRVWKKKGQKRSTRRSVMRPGVVKPRAAPTFVAVEDEEDEDTEDESVPLKGTQLHGGEPLSSQYGDISEDELAMLNEHRQPSKKAYERSASEDEAYGSEDNDDEERSKGKRGNSSKSKTGKKAKHDKKAKEKDNAKSGERTINPNAHSHMNFRSLKIRNKNSKAKGGGRFGDRGAGKGRR